MKRKLIFRMIPPATHIEVKQNATLQCSKKPGRAYIYFIYGNHYCLNAVTEKAGKAGAVLIRAIEPVSGIKLQTNGPGKLTKALKIDKKLNRADLTKGDLIIAKGKTERYNIAAAKRIGISKASNKLLRFYIKGNKYVSKI